MYYWIITLRRALKEPEARGALRSAALLLATGVIFYMLVEKWSFVDALYFSVTTLTTVGFGNPAPTTDLGKLFTVFFVLSGVGMFLAVINAVGKAAVHAQLDSPKFASKAKRRSGQADDGSGESEASIDDEA
ncbi:MAG: potassium channel family protein [Solirubrobacterales bacterium]